MALLSDKLGVNLTTGCKSLFVQRASRTLRLLVLRVCKGGIALAPPFKKACPF